MAKLQHPGVFVEEAPSGVRTIRGVPTSITAFVGRTQRGPLDEPVHLKSLADYERRFGGLWRESTVSFAVKQFFENGGEHAIVVRAATRGDAAPKPAVVRLAEGAMFRASTPGSWGLNLNIAIDHTGVTDNKLFNLTVTDQARTERFPGLSVDPASPQFAGTMLQQSELIRLEFGLGAAAPSEQTAVAVELSGTDGGSIGTAEVTAPENRTTHTGLNALDKVDLFNLLCIPPYAADGDLDVAKDWAPAAEYCRARRAFLVIDAPASWTIDSAGEHANAFRAVAQRDGALYFPRVLAADPLNADKPAAYAPCGAVAGVMSRADKAHGVWKAPANEALRGVNGTSIKLDAAAQSRLPPDINCLREFPDRGVLIWGAHTLEDAGSEWRYVNVRRFALYVEQSIDQGTQWAVFEPNSEPTWEAVRQAVNTFLFGLWRAGALMGTKPEEAFFVRCDRTTMTQDDIQNGTLVAVIGLAIVRPAEFVILKFSQKTADASR